MWRAGRFSASVQEPDKGFHRGAGRAEGLLGHLGLLVSEYAEEIPFVWTDVADLQALSRRKALHLISDGPGGILRAPGLVAGASNRFEREFLDVDTLGEAGFP